MHYACMYKSMYLCMMYVGVCVVSQLVEKYSAIILNLINILKQTEESK